MIEIYWVRFHSYVLNFSEGVNLQLQRLQVKIQKGIAGWKALCNLLSSSLKLFLLDQMCITLEMKETVSNKKLHLPSSFYALLRRRLNLNLWIKRFWTAIFGNQLIISRHCAWRIYKDACILSWLDNME